MAQTENPGRERILGRIKEALKTPVPPRLHAETEDTRSLQPIFAPIPDALERFRRECAGNNTELIVTEDARATGAALESVLASLPAGEIFAQDARELREMPGALRDRKDVRWSSEGGPHENSQATITLAEVLVAQTGSVMVSAACGGRGASIVAPVHIVVAKAGQLAATLEEGFARIRERETAAKNSYLCLITGSSRTADIEKILVMGAHGPRRLV
ncbi:MAG: LUD domain-containing protein, partial [Candidatus Acidiferrales bacterium]